MGLGLPLATQNNVLVAPSSKVGAVVVLSVIGCKTMNFYSYKGQIIMGLLQHPKIVLNYQREEF